MRKILLFQILILALTISIIGCGEDEEKVNELKPEDENKMTEGLIPDPTLEAAIREAIDKPKGTITKDDLKEVTELRTSFPELVSDLTGLEYCANLRKLRIEGPITDLLPLSSITSLQRLSISITAPVKIIDISPLSFLTNLQELNLTAPKISNMSSAFEGLINLQSLYLGLPLWLNIDILALKGLTNLRYLEIRGGKIRDISPLSSLVSLEDLWLRSYPIRDISFLSGLKKLQLLAIPCNEISDISPLSKLTSLRNIDLSINKITDMSPLVDNPGIDRGDYVYLEGNPLSEESISIYIPILEERGVNVYF